MATNPVVIRDSPRPSGAQQTSEAGKVEVETKEWSRVISKALRDLYTQVQALSTSVAASTPATASSTASGQAVTDASQKIDAPATPVSDGDMVLFSGTSGRKVKSGGKPSGETTVVPKSFSIVLDMAVLNPGAGTNITVDVNITVMGLIGAASGGIGAPGDNLPNAITAAYDNTSASNSGSNARFKVYKTDGTALPAIGSYRVNFMVFP